MSTWAQRMHRRAANLGSVVTSCGHYNAGPYYPHRLEKVKFGHPLDDVCKTDIPAPLLVLILKLNKEAPSRKNVFRAPGHQGAIKKLIHFLQTGRLINVDNYSVYTIASVLKTFLRKIPGGIFGRHGEQELFEIVNGEVVSEQPGRISRLIMSLPGHTQRLLVLLFGTFRVIAINADKCATGMTSEALGVSVAPSFFQSCDDGKTATMDDVLRYKVATRIMKQMIDQFADFDLFGRDNYEYYARVTGRVIRVQEEWICSFRYPVTPRESPDQPCCGGQFPQEAEKTWLQCQCKLIGLNKDESQSTPALLTTSTSVAGDNGNSLGVIPEDTLLESCARLSVSLDGPELFSNKKPSTLGSCSSNSTSSPSTHSSNHMTMDELRAVNRYAESTRSLSYLPQVHERQTARMRTRSEWFLGARSLEVHDSGLRDSSDCDDICYHQAYNGKKKSLRRRPIQHGSASGLQMHMCNSGSALKNITSYTSTIVDSNNIGFSASAESLHGRTKRLSRRGILLNPHRQRSTRRNKENGSRHGSFRNNSSKKTNNTATSDTRSASDRYRRDIKAVSFEQQHQP